jgi:hypothetical protein
MDAGAVVEAKVRVRNIGRQTEYIGRMRIRPGGIVELPESMALAMARRRQVEIVEGSGERRPESREPQPPAGPKPVWLREDSEKGVSGPDGTQAPKKRQYPCDRCSRRFRTKGGLGLHKFFKHSN